MSVLRVANPLPRAEARGSWAPSLRDSAGIDGIVYPTLKRGANIHCAYGAGRGVCKDGGVWGDGRRNGLNSVPSLRDSAGIGGIVYPTLKRGANIHCAYGAGRGVCKDGGMVQRRWRGFAEMEGHCRKGQARGLSLLCAG